MTCRPLWLLLIIMAVDACFGFAPVAVAENLGQRAIRNGPYLPDFPRNLHVQFVSFQLSISGGLSMDGAESNALSPVREQPEPLTAGRVLDGPVLKLPVELVPENSEAGLFGKEGAKFPSIILAQIYDNESSQKFGQDSFLERRRKSPFQSAVPDYSGPKYADGTEWTGSNFNTDKTLSLSSVRSGHTVEIDPFGHTVPKGFIKAAQEKGAKVVVYLPGGHCYTDGGKDGCDQYSEKGIKFGRTGAVWENKGERRILDQSHPEFVARQEERFLDVFRLGANGSRYDNLHSPEGGSKATKEQVEAIYGAFLQARDRFIQAGGKEPKGGFGLVPHNSMPIWEQLINEGKVNPKDIFMLGLERTTQLSGDADPLNHPEIEAALRIAKRHNLGVAITNFQLEHTKDKQGKNKDVNLDDHYPNYQDRVLQAARNAGVKVQITTVPDEDNYYSFDSGGRKNASIEWSEIPKRGR